MIKMASGAAIIHAINLAEIALANPNINYEINTDTANKVADFIETLENRFTENND